MDQEYTQSLGLAFEPGASQHHIDRAVYDSQLAALSPALKRLKAAYDDNSLALLRLAEQRDDLADMRQAIEKLQAGARDIILFGTGGSSLGGQTLAQLAGWNVPGFSAHMATHHPRLHFLDNLDPDGLTALLRDLDLKTSRFIIISKSGSTPETLMQMLVTIDALTRAGLDWNLAQHLLIVTMPETPGDKNALAQLSAFHSLPVLAHERNIGGRYSVLSNVGLLPAMLLGLDVVALREGAQSVINPLLHNIEVGQYAPAQGAALQYVLKNQRGINISVVMPYSDKLRAFARWYVQLWSESLGKGGAGTTPLASAGPVDQHSQLQLFLDGPADKLITIIKTDTAAKGPIVPQSLARDPNLGYLAGKSIGDLVDAEQRATAQTLAGLGRPVRVLAVPQLNERSLGALLMHFMIETILMADILNVDPFDQPAVEEGKMLAAKYLGSTSGVK